MILHWAIAVAILFQLSVGFAMTRLDVLSDTLRFAVFQWHKTVGLLILALTLARIAWRVLNPPPAHAPMSGIENAAAHAVHMLFYGAMLLVPLTGWLLVSASPTAIPTFLFTVQSLPWPHLPLPAAWHGEGTAELAAGLHMWLAYSTAALLVLHVAGALKHSVVDHQPSFSRMLPVGHLPRQSTTLLAVPLSVGLVAVFLAGGLATQRGLAAGAAAASPAGTAASDAPAASGWTIDPAASRITFETSFSGKPLLGTVGRWTASVDFDPDALQEAKARITVDPASIAVDDAFVSGSVGGPDGFDTAAHPSVAIDLDRFEAKGEQRFVGHGTATIKDKTAPVDVDFTFAPAADGTASVKGTVVLDRLVFGLGLQNDATAQWLGKDITVTVDLKARRADAAPAS